MDDEEYVTELIRILRNPTDPVLVESPMHDDSFGRDIRVTSARVVPGERAPMVEIGFELDLPSEPELAGVPAEGSFQLPVDAEWRRLSNYESPADYAPLVAHRVVMQIHRHVARYQRWASFLEHLGHEGTVHRVSPGRIEVVSGVGETLTVVVTPDQWEQVVLRHAGNAHDYFTDLLGPRQTDEHFLVFWEGDLERSVREALPPVRPWRPMPFVPGGGWFAHKPGTDGRGAGSGPSPMGGQ